MTTKLIKYFKDIEILKDKGDRFDISFDYQDRDIAGIWWKGYATLWLETNKDGDYFLKVFEAFSSEEKEKFGDEVVDYELGVDETESLQHFVNITMSYFINGLEDTHKCYHEQNEDYYKAVI